MKTLSYCKPALKSGSGEAGFPPEHPGALRVENMAWRMFSGGSRGKSVSLEALEEGLFLWRLRRKVCFSRASGERSVSPEPPEEGLFLQSLRRKVCFSGASRGRSVSPEHSGALQRKVHFSGGSGGSGINCFSGP